SFRKRLELHIQVSLKDLIFSERVEGKCVPRAPRPKVAIDLLAVAVGEIENNRIAQGKSAPDREAFHIDAAVEEVGIDQVWIDRELFDMLVKGFKLPVVLLFDSADPETDLIGVTLVSLVRMAGGSGPVIGLEVRR